MELMTPALWHLLPPLDSQREASFPLVYCHYFLPDTQWDWYVLEFDGNDVFYGWVSHMSQEFATFYLSELRILRGLRGRPVTRDKHFTPLPLWHVQQHYGGLPLGPTISISPILQTTSPHARITALQPMDTM